MRNITQNNTKTQNTQNRKTNKTRKQTYSVLKIKIRVIRRYQMEANNNETPYCTAPTYSYININP